MISSYRSVVIIVWETRRITGLEEEMLKMMRIVFFWQVRMLVRIVNYILDWCLLQILLSFSQAWFSWERYLLMCWSLVIIVNYRDLILLLRYRMINWERSFILYWRQISEISFFSWSIRKSETANGLLLAYHVRSACAIFLGDIKQGFVLIRIILLKSLMTLIILLLHLYCFLLISCIIEWECCGCVLVKE